MARVYKFRDLKGYRFGILTPVEFNAPGAPSRSLWKCLCECGNISFVESSKLLLGGARSCGCQQHPRDPASRRTQPGEYATWYGMKDRCQNKRAANYGRYGAIGVTVCARWQSFENFLADMGPRPEGKTLDRHPNPAGNYEPGNCRWATPLEQAGNKRSDMIGEIDHQIGTLMRS